MTYRWTGPILAALMLSVAACATSSTTTVPPGTAEADKFLYERGQAAVEDEKWADAREYFRNIVDNYPQSPLRPDAKLALGDTYLSQKGTENYLLAANEFREFQTFYPTHPRADYAQLQLARSYAGQMLAPERDQSATRDTVKEVDVFMQRYPNSALMPQARELEREAKDRLSQAAYRVGFFYFRSRWYPGAIDRFREILANDPGFTRRDAVYFHLGESLYRTDKKAEALPYYERLLAEFDQSEFLVEAQQRVAELKGGTTAGK
jgi:outer membrane protein assembly factor BamD